MKCLLENLLNRNPIRICKRLIKTLSAPIPMGDPAEIKKPKYDGRSKKRQWQDRRSDQGRNLEGKLLKIDDGAQKGLPDKIKRRKYAILMGYSGVEYFGMQRNPNTKTIEEEFFKALKDCDFIDQLCYDQVQNMQFQRAARTDKGVSAARQVVSLKLKETFNIAAVNEKLSDQIRLFASKRVTKGFNSKSQCDGRTYIYVTPSVVFSDQEVEQKGFRISQETLSKINETLALYVGTKNFHNFTVKKKYGDPSAKRFIKAFSCGEPFVENDVEFCTLKVWGQSFMMHQIRKMVGLVLAVVRGKTTPEVLIKALGEDKVNIPRAPGLGLLLDYVHYERYNIKYGSDGMHETLTWQEVDKEVEEFKHRQILPIIVKTEIEEEQMVWWVKNKLTRHSYDGEAVSDDEGDGGDDDAEENVVVKTA